MLSMSVGMLQSNHTTQYPNAIQCKKKQVWVVGKSGADYVKVADVEAMSARSSGPCQQGEVFQATLEEVRA